MNDRFCRNRSFANYGAVGHSASNRRLFDTLLNGDWIRNHVRGGCAHSCPLGEEADRAKQGRKARLYTCCSQCRREIEAARQRGAIHRLCIARPFTLQGSASAGRVGRPPCVTAG